MAAQGNWHLDTNIPTAIKRRFPCNCLAVALVACLRRGNRLCMLRNDVSLIPHFFWMDQSVRCWHFKPRSQPTQWLVFLGSVQEFSYTQLVTLFGCKVWVAGISQQQSRSQQDSHSGSTLRT